MRKLTSLFLATTLALGAVTVVHAAADNLTPPPAGSEQPHHKPPHRPGDFMFKNLNLTDAQKKQIHDIFEASHKEGHPPMKADLQAGHDIVTASSFDHAKAEALADKMAAGAKQRTLQMLETQNKIYNILTPEQKKQYNANFEKRLTEKRPHHGKMLPPPAEGQDAPPPAQ
ncbi:ATP-independent periplasmic protein-refolding chaperone Spy [Candidatus Pantoea multigeneris]|uniref:ATP-independent periplasmic protein-refolding chaperone n=1 Tax=Candidatus Pantoea multigeneris TaxID=2608357 RepID=A0ABX0R3X6_9GAMM|nr:ATP-independent periplasmic protein-refolding chaperone Spy [Pantoea multigeneris]NIF20108.1 ATP-independent periplasmic protein-refolding chaperone [Pantoea multigeneris]